MPIVGVGKAKRHILILRVSIGRAERRKRRAPTRPPPRRPRARRANRPPWHTSRRRRRPAREATHERGRTGTPMRDRDSRPGTALRLGRSRPPRCASGLAYPWQSREERSGLRARTRTPGRGGSDARSSHAELGRSQVGVSSMQSSRRPLRRATTEPIRSGSDLHPCRHDRRAKRSERRSRPALHPA